MRAAPPESPPTASRSAKPTRDYIQRRREEVEQGKEADEPGPIKRDVNVVLRAWHWIANHLMWVGTSLPPTPDKSFGLIAVNLSPFGFQILYQSVMNVAGDTKEGLLKCVLLRDAAGGWKRPEPNTAGQFCDRSLAKCAGSIKLCGACGANHGALEVVVGPQGSPLAYLAVCKPGLGLVTSQALGPVAGFSVDSAGNILGVDGGEVQYPPPPKCCCAFDSLGP